MDLDGLRRGLQLVLGAGDDLLQLPRPGEDADGLVADVIPLVLAAAAGGGRPGRRLAQQLPRDGHGLLGLPLGLVLVHELQQRPGFVPGLALGTGEHRLGEFVHAQAVHLGGQIQLRFGVEPEAEQPLGGLAGAGHVPGPLREPQGTLFARLHDLVVGRGDAVEERERLRVLVVLLAQGGDFEGELGVPRGGQGRGLELVEGLVLLLGPPEQVGHRQLQVDFLGPGGGGELLLDVGVQVGLQVGEFEHRVGVVQHRDHRLVVVVVDRREGHLLAVEVRRPLVPPGVDADVDPRLLLAAAGRHRERLGRGDVLPAGHLQEDVGDGQHVVRLLRLRPAGHDLEQRPVVVPRR